MLYLSLPALQLLFGIQPLDDLSAAEFILHFGPYFVASMAIAVFASKGSYTFRALALRVATFGVHIRALSDVLLRRPPAFAVTPKRRVRRRQLRSIAPSIVFAVLLVASIVIGLAKDRDAATVNNAAFAGIHLVVLAFGMWPAFIRRRGPQRARTSTLGDSSAATRLAVASELMAPTRIRLEPTLKSRCKEPVRDGLLLVVLDDRRRAHSSLVRIQAGRLPSSTLTEKVPALVESDLDLADPALVGGGRLLDGLILQLVFFVDECFDAAENLLLVHHSPFVRSRLRSSGRGRSSR